MKKSEKSILGQRLAALRKRPHTNGSDFWKKVRQEQEWEREKLGIRFERDGDNAVWNVIRGKGRASRFEGYVYRNMASRSWFNNHGASPHRTRLEAAKALLGEAR